MDIDMKTPTRKDDVTKRIGSLTLKATKGRVDEAVFLAELAAVWRKGGLICVTTRDDVMDTTGNLNPVPDATWWVPKKVPV